LSCGLRETSRVDYTEREERLRERKGKMYVSPLHHRRRPTTEREEIFFFFFLIIIIIIIIIFRRGVFTNFIKQNYTERRKTERKKFLYVFTITSSGPPQREEILREILIIFRGAYYIIFIF
jgi:hypothetical protein